MSGPRFADFWGLGFSRGGHPLTRLLSQRLGACIAYVAYRLGFSPSAVTLVGLGLGLATSMAFASAPLGTSSAIVLALAYQLAYGCDCADGQLARATGKTSAFGAWLDVASDYVRDIAIALAVLYLLVEQHGLSTPPAVLGASLLVTGLVVSVHTTVSLDRGGQEGRVSGPPSGPRLLFRILTDAPLFLLVLCIARDWPTMLFAYAAAMGALYLFGAAALAAMRLSRAT